MEQKILAVIGNPISHSKSPLVHNAMLKKIANDYYYGSVEVKEEELPDFIKSMSRNGFRGFSVTIPHKVNALKLVDVIDPVAQKIGAINTILNENKKLIGYNTDCMGAINALKCETNLNKKIVYVLGSGGAARAIIVGLVENNCKVKIWGRNPKHTKMLAEDFGCEYGELERIDNKCDILINATPIGMHPNEDESPFPKHLLKKEIIVFDIVYNPLKTKLIKEAQRAGCKVILGSEMFLEQAFEQFKLFTKMSPDEKGARRILLDELKKNVLDEKTLFLIGYRGTGKTSIGKKVAKALGREFIDTDELIVKLAGKSIPKIFEENGETAFREFETLALRCVCSRPRLVVSCGGGIITKERNFPLLKKGIVCLLSASPEIIFSRIYGDKNRPALTDKNPKEEIIHLLSVRKPLYDSAKDFEINTSKNSVSKCAFEIVKQLKNY